MYSLFKAKGAPNREINSLILNQKNFGKEDGVHPTKQGYQLIAETVYGYLKKNRLLKRGKKIICFGDSITYGAYMSGEGTSNGDTYPAFLSRLINH
ncbi:GDSL-like Lipase/Acylhydrolase [compost metagenome]